MLFLLVGVVTICTHNNTVEFTRCFLSHVVSKAVRAPKCGYRAVFDDFLFVKNISVRIDGA